MSEPLVHGSQHGNQQGTVERMQQFNDIIEVEEKRFIRQMGASFTRL